MAPFMFRGVGLLCVLLLFVCATQATGLTAPLGEDEKQVPVVREDPPEEPRNQGRLTFGGIVTAVDKVSITVACGERRVERYGPGPDGKFVLEKIIIWKAQEREFLGCAELASGKFKRTRFAGAEATYRLSDVKVGDHVEVGYIRLNGVDIAEDICIRCRPDGLVPPAPGEDPKEPNKWHEGRNKLELVRTNFPTVIAPKLALGFLR
jgi:hypothetical protein